MVWFNANEFPLWAGAMSDAGSEDVSRREEGAGESGEGVGRLLEEIVEGGDSLHVDPTTLMVGETWQPAPLMWSVVLEYFCSYVAPKSTPHNDMLNGLCHKIFQF